jgi:5-methylcytosine-specific restriction endonuclease McrBC GTP-binding regulatory subunit McrB
MGVEVEILVDFQVDPEEGNENRSVIQYVTGDKENVPADTADLWEAKGLAKRTIPLKSSTFAKKADDKAEEA